MINVIINAAPPEGERDQQRPFDAENLHAAREMIEDHQQYRHAANTSFGTNMPLMSSAFDTAMWLDAA